MKTSWSKPVSVISFIRTLLIVLAVAVCTVAAEDLETLRKKARRGDANAQFLLGGRYYFGRGVPKDDAEGVKWFRKAAEQGYAEAQYFLGFYLDLPQETPSTGNGNGQVEREPRLTDLRRARKQGNAFRYDFRHRPPWIIKDGSHQFHRRRR